MGIFNLCDNRTSENDTRVDAVFEVDCSDCDSLGLPKHTKSWKTWMEGVSVYDATMRASGMRGLVTLYLYDEGAARQKWLGMIHQDLPDQPFNPVDALAKKLIQPY